MNIPFPVFRNKQEKLFNESEIEETLDLVIENIIEVIENFTSPGSGWEFVRVEIM